LCCLPTPVHRLERLGRSTGLDLWIKRDDLTGFAGGGNKGRKLEYIAPAVLESGADTVVACGSLQSNFVRQLGALCAVLGLRLVAVVMALPFEPPFGRPSGEVAAEGGNAELDALFGVEVQVEPDGTWDELFAAASARAGRERAAGRKVFEVPIGGSMALGAYGFAAAAAEVGEGFDSVVVPTSSGSTHAGLAWGFAGSATRVVGVSCDPEPDVLDEVARMCAELDGLAGVSKGVRPETLELDRSHVGAGYGVPSPEGYAAQLRVAREEGIVLDPVYSAKAMAGLISLAAEGALSGRVLFWHTGGLPAACAPRANRPG
jgi:D-cysteine desulfhydrase/L-cysteate sulfo-lyase